VFSIKKALKSNGILRALTGLKIKQFKMLAVNFGLNLKTSFEEYRNVSLDLGREFILKSSEEKLFFILFYMKCYPTFEVAGFFFNVNKSSCCRWVQWFLPALQKTLGKELVLPERKISDPKEFLRLFPEVQATFVDGTERPIQRPKDSKRQRENYSGKKKRHTRKNIVVNDEKKRILIVTETEEGKKHDFKIYKDDGVGDAIPDDIPCFVDTGFQGIEKASPKLRVIMPKKKPRGGELSLEDKENNKEISKRRILSEHAIGGVKRYGIVSDVYRNHRKGFDDEVMLVACGLWNYYLKTA